MGLGPGLRFADHHHATRDLKVGRAHRLELGGCVKVLIGDEDLSLPDLGGRVLHPRKQFGSDEVLRALARILFRFLGRPDYCAAQDLTAWRDLDDHTLGWVDPFTPDGCFSPRRSAKGSKSHCQSHRFASVHTGPPHHDRRGLFSQRAKIQRPMPADKWTCHRQSPFR